jgi:hypothetical protein
MATPIQITVTVDANGAVTGFQQISSSGDAMGTKVVTAAEAASAAIANQSKATLTGAAAVAVLTAKWEQEQKTIAEVNARIKENMAAMQATAASAKTLQGTVRFQDWAPMVKNSSTAFMGMTSEQMKANVAGRLLEQTLGLQNRALNQVAARSALLGPLMAAAFPIGILAGVAPIFVKIGEEIANGATELGGYTKAVQQIRAETVKASNEAFVNPKTLEVGQQHLNQLNSQITVLNKASAIESSRSQMVAEQATLEGKITAFLFSGTINGAVSAELQGKALEIEEKRRVVLEAITGMTKHLNDEVARSQESTALIGKSGIARIAQERANALADIGREYHLDANQDPVAIANVNKAAAALIVDANNKAAAQTVELRRQEAMETMKLRDQVTENALSGIAKIKQEEADHIKETLAEDVQKMGLSAAEVQKTQEYQAQIAKIHQDTNEKIRVSSIQNAAELAAIQDKTRDTFLQGDDLIFAHQEEAASKARAEYEKAPSPEAWQKYLAEIDLADAEAQQKLRESHKVTADKDARILARTVEMQQRAAEDMKTAQEDAALAAVPEWQRASAQIQIELNRRERAIEDQKLRELAAEDLTRDQILAINQDADAKRYDAIVQADIRIREENKRLTESLGSDLQSVFDDIASGNIGKRILSNMEKLFFQILAQWILSLNIMKNAAGSILGSIVFGPGSTGAGVFGGGGGSGAGTSILGSLFGGSGSNSAPSGAAFQPGGIFSDPSAFAGGSGLTSAIAGSSAATGGLLPSASNALTTSTLTDALGGITAGASSVAGSSARSSSFAAGSPLVGLAALAPGIVGNFGGKAGQIGGLLSMLAILGNSQILAGLSGGLIGFGVGESHGGFLGSLAGAGSGALTGFLAAGPIGALIGGVVGLLGGIFGGIFGGNKRKKQANALADNTLLPDITQISTGFDGFQIDSSSAIQQLEQLRTDSQKQLSALQSQGKDVFNKKVDPAIDAAEAHIRSTQAERDRRSAQVFGPPQFDTGGVFRASGGRGTAILEDGETVIKPGPSRSNKELLATINAGGKVRSTSHITLVVNAIDARSFDDWAKRGGAEMLQRALDRHATEGH